MKRSAIFTVFFIVTIFLSTPIAKIKLGPFVSTIGSRFWVAGIMQQTEFEKPGYALTSEAGYLSEYPNLKGVDQGAFLGGGFSYLFEFKQLKIGPYAGMSVIAFEKETRFPPVEMDIGFPAGFRMKLGSNGMFKITWVNYIFPRNLHDWDAYDGVFSFKLGYVF